MITGHVFIATSLDGYIARNDGEIDWLMKQAVEGEDHGFEAFMASVDGLIMGRGTFEKVLTFDSWVYAKPVVVLSRTLTSADIPASLSGKVTLSDAPPQALMDELAAKGWQRVYVDGGKVIQSFLRAGLIADLKLSRVPILIGEGIPLFGPMAADLDLEHLNTRSFPSGLVTSHYRIGVSTQET